MNENTDTLVFVKDLIMNENTDTLVFVKVKSTCTAFILILMQCRSKPWFVEACEQRGIAGKKDDSN